MIKNHLFLLAFAGLFLLSSCSTKEDDVLADGSRLATITAYAPGGQSWSEGDDIAVMDGWRTTRFTCGSAGDRVRFISAKGLKTKSSRVWAVHPYAEENQFVAGRMTALFPAENASAFWAALAPGTARKMDLAFSDLSAAFSISFTDRSVRSVRISGNDGEVLAGTVILEEEGGQPVISSVSVPVRSVAHVENRPFTSCTLAVLPVTLEKGFRVLLANAEGKTYEKNISDPTELNSSECLYLTLDDIRWSDAPVMTLVDQGASEATFRFGAAGDYQLQVGDRVVRWNSQEEDPVHTVAGLAPDTEYEAVLRNAVSGTSSAPVRFKTLTSAAMQAEAPVAQGGDLFYEDFGPLAWGGDPFRGATGMDPAGTMVGPEVGCPFVGEPVSGTRMADWAADKAASALSFSGCVQVNGRLLTPVLSAMAETGILEVSMDVRAEADAQVTFSVATAAEVSGGIAGSAIYLPVDPVPVEGAAGWQRISATLTNVSPTDRIAVQASGVYVDNMRVRVNKYGAESFSPEVFAGNCFWSDIQLSWASPSVDAYRIYLDDVLYETLDKTVMQYHLRGLEPGRNYKVQVASVRGDKEDRAEAMEIRTAFIRQLTKNPSTTSVAVRMENCTGGVGGDRNPCLFIELYDGPDTLTAKRLYSTYVLDAQMYSHGSPFLNGMAYGNNADGNFLALSLGGLSAAKDYWFRVKCVDRYEDFKTYVSSTPSVSWCETPAGNSAFSSLVKLTTASAHTPDPKELAWQDFDDVQFFADYVNGAVGAVPAFKKAGVAATTLLPNVIRDWTGDWSFYPLRTGYNSTQLAGHFGYATQQTADSEVFKLTKQSSAGLITGTAPGVGFKIYTFKEAAGALSGWMSSNNTYPGMGYVQLGNYYGASDGKLTTPTTGMIVTPALADSRLGSAATSCVLQFKALALQGRFCDLEIWVYDAATSAWSQLPSVSCYNSAGLTTEATSWSVTSDAHRWYDHSVNVSLKNGDRIAIVGEKTAAVALDEISVKIK